MRRKLEAKEDAAKPKTLCAVAGGAASMAEAVDAFVADVVSAIGGGPH